MSLKRFLVLNFTLFLALSLTSQDMYKTAPEDRAAFALYTVHDNILKLTAQFYPLINHDRLTVKLEIQNDTSWIPVATSKIIYPGFTAPFRVDNWDDSKEARYRVNWQDKSYIEGVIRKNPVDKEVVSIASFTCNSIYEQHGGHISRQDIVDNILKIQPDLLFFSGDQVYDHKMHLRDWLRFGEDFGAILNNFPTICIPDDHDVGHYNLWGEGGKVSNSIAGEDGGFFMPAEYVKEVERAQTSHLPDPYDPTPIAQGIGVYYTNLNWGGVSFAILEDRKFKSGPGNAPDPDGGRIDHITVPDYDPADLDVPGLKLLGDRQLAFLDHWVQDWEGVDMKAVLSQTIFTNAASVHGNTENFLYADLDANGWPQTGRRKALERIRKGFAIHIAGDQHLGTLIQHGLDDWGDASYSFCVPAIANLYMRWWRPIQPAVNPVPGQPAELGDFYDGFGNKISMLAVANPEFTNDHPTNRLTTRAAGWGLVEFNKENRTITFNCWPRNVDVTLKASNQYPGWPITIAEKDNYGKQPAFQFPELLFGDVNPIIKLYDQNNQLVYAKRAHKSSFKPWVFDSGTYRVIVEYGTSRAVLKFSTADKHPKTIKVDL